MMNLTLEQRQIAIAMVEYLREQGYILSPDDSKALSEFKARETEYISGKEAAQVIGCSPAYVIKLRNNGQLGYKMIGSKPMYSVKSINRYLSKRTVKDRMAV